MLSSCIFVGFDHTLIVVNNAMSHLISAHELNDLFKEHFVQNIFPRAIRQQCAKKAPYIKIESTLLPFDIL